MNALALRPLMMMKNQGEVTLMLKGSNSPIVGIVAGVALHDDGGCTVLVASGQWLFVLDGDGIAGFTLAGESQVKAYRDLTAPPPPPAEPAPAPAPAPAEPGLDPALLASFGGGH